VLKIGLKQIGCCIVVGKVLDQPENLRNIGIVADMENTRMIQWLGSAVYPELGSSSLYIGGSLREKDSEPFGYRYDNLKDAKEAIEDIRHLVAKVNHPEGAQSCLTDCAIELEVIE